MLALKSRLKKDAIQETNKIETMITRRQKKLRLARLV